MDDFFDLEEEDLDWADERELISRYENMVRNHQPAFFSVDDFEQLYFYYMRFFIDGFPMQDGQLKKGGAVIKTAISQYPDAEILHLLQAYHAYKERRTTKKVLIDKLGKIPFPDYEQEHFQHVLAHIYRQVGDRRKAFPLFASLLENADDMEDKVRLTYEILFLLGSPEDAPKAVEYCNYLLKTGELDQSLLFGDIYWSFLLKPIAVPVFELLTKQYTFSMDAWLYLGKAYFDAAKLEQAIQAFRYAVALSNHPFPLVSLGRVLAISGKITESFECYLDALQLDPKQTGLYAEMGEILYYSEDAEQAIHYFSLALDADKNDMNALFGMALALSSLERYEESVAYLLRAKKIDRLSIDAWLLLADDYTELNRDEEAVKIYRQLIKKYPKDVDVWLSYSNYYVVMENFEQACVIAKQGLAILPDNPFLLYRIANYYFLETDIPLGISYLQLAIHADAKLINFFTDYDEEIMKIPEVAEIVKSL